MVLFPKGSDDIQVTINCIAVYGGLILLCVGFIGNSLNILVFGTLRLFRKNPSAFCVLVDSLANFGQIFIALISQILFLGFGIDGLTNSVVWCKLKNVLSQFFDLISVGTICLATLDQYLSTNPRSQLRQISSLRLIQQLIIVLIILAVLHSLPFVIFFDLQPSQGCVVKNFIWSTYYSSFYFPVVIGLLPISITIILGSMAFYHVRHLIRRGISTVRRRLDRQLTAMIFVRVLSFVVLTVPYVIERLIFLNLFYNKNTTPSKGIVRLIATIGMLLLCVNHAISFYIFYFTSTRFRRQVKYVTMKSYWRLVSCLLMKKSKRPQRNQISPILPTVPSGGLSESI